MYKCSFCGKGQKQVIKLVVNGTGTAAVCNECAQICIDFAEDERAAAEPVNNFETHFVGN